MPALQSCEKMQMPKAKEEGAHLVANNQDLAEVCDRMRDIYTRLNSIRGILIGGEDHFSEYVVTDANGTLNYQHNQITMIIKMAIGIEQEISELERVLIQ